MVNDVKEFINLFACFIDKYSMSFYKKDDVMYQKTRVIHYALQDFIKEYETVDDRYEYYDFFFENIVKEDSSWEEFLRKYGVLKEVLSDDK